MGAKTIVIASAEELDIVKTFECGQCFRWNAGSDGVYTGIAGEYPARIWQENGRVYVRSAAPESFWKDYFDLDRDYAAISRSFYEAGKYLAVCTDYGMGIRILHQDPWEALCSFIISQCNNISRIKGIVERLCSLCGEELQLDGAVYYAFPDAEKLASMSADELAVLRSGYRAPYIISAAKAVTEGSISLDELIKTDWVTAKNELKKLNGIGEKVANCVVLFGLRHMEAFPIDTWIRKALKEHFPPDFAPTALGEYAGLAQQYIFYHARSEGV